MIQMGASLASAPFFHVITFASFLAVVGDVFFTGPAHDANFRGSQDELNDSDLCFLFFHKFHLPFDVWRIHAKIGIGSGTRHLGEHRRQTSGLNQFHLHSFFA